jgi:ABC-type transporter Mla MlaB component
MESLHNPSVTVEARPDGCQLLHLAGDLSVFQATELHRVATLLVQQDGDVQLECAKLRSIDLAAGQILLALYRSLSTQGRRFRIQAYSKEAGGLFSLVGLGSELAAVATETATAVVADTATPQPSVHTV